MIGLIQSMIDRVKAMFTLDAVLDLEQQFLMRQAERKAELMREADRYQKEGLVAIAGDLRRQAETLSERRPLQTVLPFMAEESPVPRTPAAPRAIADGGDRRATPQRLKPIPALTSRKKGK